MALPLKFEKFACVCGASKSVHQQRRVAVAQLDWGAVRQFACRVRRERENDPVAKGKVKSAEHLDELSSGE